MATNNWIGTSGDWGTAGPNGPKNDLKTNTSLFPVVGHGRFLCAVWFALHAGLIIDLHQ
jgi:hypothetical protein